MTRLRDEKGQATVLAAILMVALIGLAGIVVDVGSWFRQQRVSQATVDSAALAGAQALPHDPASATSLATDFANKNGGVAGAAISVSSHFTVNDEITVTQSRPASGFFSNLFGISTVTVHAHASAISEVPTEVMGVAPITVDIHHQDLSGPGCPCFDVPTTIQLGKKDVPGAFGMINLDQSAKGTTGASTLADWITSGYQSYLPLGDYDSDPGAKFSDTPIQNALQSKYGQDLLFPVYDSLTGQGSGAPYQIVGWAAFHLTNSQASGNNGTLSGWFDSVIWNGIVSTKATDPAIPDLGVHSVALID